MKKEKKATTVKKSRVEKPYNNGTMSSSAFFGWLRSSLRKLSSRGWIPITETKKAARVPYKGENKRRKYSYVCSICKGEFADSEISIHHIQPVGSLKSFDDLGEFAKNLFCEASLLQCVCTSCHHSIHHPKDEENNN